MAGGIHGIGEDTTVFLETLLVQFLEACNPHGLQAVASSNVFSGRYSL